MRPKRKLPEKRGYLALFATTLLFAVVTSLFNPALAAVEAICTVALFFTLRAAETRRNQELLDYMKHRDHAIESASRGTIVNAAIPMVIFQPESEEIIWTNRSFLEMTGNPDHLFDTKLSETVPEFNYRWLTDGDTQAPEPVLVQGERYLVYGNLIDGNLAICYWVDITQYADVELKYRKSRPVAAVLLIDNYEDLMRGIEESERSVLLSELHKRISQWADPTSGILCRFDREHYLLLFEEQHLDALQRQRFSLLETVRQVRGSNEITATLSIGIAKDADTLRALFQHATASMEMALSRGGDQVVLRDKEQYHFFGGKAKETERRTKLKSRVVANALAELLGSASKVIIMGHVFPDLDVSGAAAGLVAIARGRDIPCYVIRENEPCPADEMLDRLAELPQYEDVFITVEEAMERLDERTLLIVVDTNRPEQVQSLSLLKAVARVMLIDHHRRAATYIENPILSFEDPYASSASELSAELMQHLLEPGGLLRQEAEAVLAGIVLDTKNFTLRTGSRTFEAGAFLRRAGADTTEVRKLFQTDLDGAMARYDIVRRAKLYREGIGIAVTDTMTSRITAAKAADEMMGIANIAASFVLFPTDEKTVMLSARSIGDVNVQIILEQLGGGGNAAAAGAQLKGVSLEEAEARLHAAIDAYFEE